MEAKAALHQVSFSSDSEEEELQREPFNDTVTDSNTSDSTEYYSDGNDSNMSGLLVGYQRLYLLMSLLAHIPLFIQQLFTANLQHNHVHP